MPNLIESFSNKEKFYQKFNRSMFKTQDNEICVVNASGRTNSSLERNGIVCKKLRYTSSGRISSQWDKCIVPDTFFSDMGVFATPPLGWRCLTAGKILVHMSRNVATYHRGTSIAVVETIPSALSQWLSAYGYVDYSLETTEAKIVHAIMEPTYHSMAEGLDGLRNGRLASFAINERVAVTPAANDHFDIWYKQAIVGCVTADGAINTNMKYVAKLTA